MLTREHWVRGRPGNGRASSRWKTLSTAATARPLFFELDQSELLPAAQAALQRNAEWMQR